MNIINYVNAIKDVSEIKFEGNPALIERRKHSDPDDPHVGEKAQQRWKRAASHPDEADLEAAAEFVAQMKRKLSLRQKYLGKALLEKDS